MYAKLPENLICISEKKYYVPTLCNKSIKIYLIINSSGL